MAKTRCDCSRTHLAICLACGWRGLPTGDHISAMRMARHHELRAHPGDKDALRALNNAKTRQ